MHRKPIPLLSRGCALLLFVLASPAWAERLDALAAVVDGEIITLSDIRVALALDLPSLNGNGKSILDAMADERLMYNSAARFPIVSVSRMELDRELSLFRKRFKSEEEYHLFLSAIELEEEELRAVLRRRLLIRQYIDSRFLPFIMVEPIEVEEALQRAIAGGEAVDLDAVRARQAVRSALAAEKLGKAVKAWKEGLRKKADVEILLEPQEIAAFLQKENLHD